MVELGLESVVVNASASEMLKRVRVSTALFQIFQPIHWPQRHHRGSIRLSQVDWKQNLWSGLVVLSFSVCKLL